MSKRPHSKRLRVCVVTGTRAEFGIWRPVLRAITHSPRLELKLVVTGMHLLRQFGQTVKDVARSECPIAVRVPMYRAATRTSEAAHDLASGIKGLALAYRQLKPDIVMLLGDRLEMFAAAGAALAERIAIAHVHGGETAPGIWDEQIRHAITKMAHVHFCATPAAERRIMRMGEPRSRVHVVGAPALDLATAFYRQAKSVIPKLRLVAGTTPLLLLHPSSGDEHIEYERTLQVIDVLFATCHGPVVHAIGPNNDPGHKGILKAYAARRDVVHVEMSLPQSGFWMRMLGAGLLVGNSSCGIIEAATWGVPVVNIGDRQAGRERNANVIDVGWDRRALELALRRVLTDRTFQLRVARRKNLYGDGHASQRIVAVLEQLARDGIPLEKRFVDG
jgi:GDP/UDP-N,N'-diacetylbacillosamine 2-epimerase (hydrolysing)